VERIVGLEGVRTTAAFLQRHVHARLELIRLRSPAYEARLPAHAEFVGELKRYHDSHRLCKRPPPAGPRHQARREDPPTGLSEPTVIGSLGSAREVAPQRLHRK
jgi:hypothetical protein